MEDAAGDGASGDLPRTGVAVDGDAGLDARPSLHVALLASTSRGGLVVAVLYEQPRIKSLLPSPQRLLPHSSRLHRSLQQAEAALSSCLPFSLMGDADGFWLFEGLEEEPYGLLPLVNLSAKGGPTSTKYAERLGSYQFYLADDGPTILVGRSWSLE